MFEVIELHADGSVADTVNCRRASCLGGSGTDCLLRLGGWRMPKHLFRLTTRQGGIELEVLKPKPAIRLEGEVLGGKVALVSDSEFTVGAKTFRIVFDPEDLVAQQSADDDAAESYIACVAKLHLALLQEMDMQRVDFADLEDRDLRRHVSRILKQIIEGDSLELPADIDRERLSRDVLNEAVGLGPLEYLLERDDVTEVMVNRYDEIYIERAGRLEKSHIQFTNDDAVRSAIERIVSPLGRRIDESSPLVDARLPDGSRVNAVIPPLALRGPCITIRKFAQKKLRAEDLVDFGAATSEIMRFLEFSVCYRRNVIISGGTGSGKTTLLNVLSNFIPESERVVTVEDAAELKLVQPHLVSLEARPANVEGKGQVSIRDLVKNCLRMRPDRIVVGECRGGEALDMLQAMNTGHDGSLTTAHANSPRDLMSRLEVMVLMAGMELPVLAIREQIGTAVDIVVQQSRFADGSRRISAVCDVLGLDGDRVQVQPIFAFRQQGFDADGRVQGQFSWTGHEPEFVRDLEDQGVQVDRRAMGLENVA